MESLPVELIGEISKKLTIGAKRKRDYRNVFSLALVSKALRKHVINNDAFWLKVLRTYHKPLYKKLGAKRKHGLFERACNFIHSSSIYYRRLSAVRDMHDHPSFCLENDTFKFAGRSAHTNDSDNGIYYRLLLHINARKKLVAQHEIILKTQMKFLKFTLVCIDWELDAYARLKTKTPSQLKPSSGHRKTMDTSSIVPANQSQNLAALSRSETPGLQHTIYSSAFAEFSSKQPLPRMPDIWLSTNGSHRPKCTDAKTEDVVDLRQIQKQSFNVKYKSCRYCGEFEELKFARHMGTVNKQSFCTYVDLCTTYDVCSVTCLVILALQEVTAKEFQLDNLFKFLYKDVCSVEYRNHLPHPIYGLGFAILREANLKFLLLCNCKEVTGIDTRLKHLYIRCSNVRFNRLTTNSIYTTRLMNIFALLTNALALNFRRALAHSIKIQKSGSMLYDKFHLALKGLESHAILNHTNLRKFPFALIANFFRGSSRKFKMQIDNCSCCDTRLVVDRRQINLTPNVISLIEKKQTSPKSHLFCSTSCYRNFMNSQTSFVHNKNNFQS